MGPMELGLGLVMLLFIAAFWVGVLALAARFLTGPLATRLDRIIALLEAQQRSSSR